MKYLLTLLLFINFTYSKEYKFTNKLIFEDSPYLQQHAHNPINWYAWNEKTLQKAKKENKLIFLSIGYSTCHWCHVMEKESFENEKLAKLFNKHYISIKIDREIDSHLDIHYQNILSNLTDRRNGWPLNAILTPSLEVLYITTYIPPVFNYGTDGLDTLLPKYAKLYKNKKQLNLLIKNNKELIAKKNIYKKRDDNNLENRYIKAMTDVYDDGFKGFFGKPRFPHAANLNLLYDIYDLTKNKTALKMVYEPLTAMAKGGIYDQIEGAFFRYSVYPDWMIPHFEKMLYTSAELIPLYARAYNDTKNKLYKKVVTQSLEQIEQRFFKDGLFYSASNADSKGVEGKYFIFNYKEAFDELIKEKYTPKEAENNLEYLDIADIGNFEDDLSNPHYNNNFEEDKTPVKLQQTLEILKKIRKKREYPFVDKKVITAWNAMMIKAYLCAGSIDKNYEIKGLKYLDTLLQNLYLDNKLYHYTINNSKPNQEALLEDYAFLIDTLLYAYQINYNNRYLKLAKTLTKKTIKKFYKNNIWYLDDKFIAKANFNDKYYTSTLGKMFENLITTANYNYDMTMLYKTKKMIKNYSNQILNDIPNHSSGILPILRLQRGDIILKSNKKDLKQYAKKIKDIKYPFLFTKYEKGDGFLACDESTCFATANNFNKIKDTINNKISNENITF